MPATKEISMHSHMFRQHFARALLLVLALAAMAPMLSACNTTAGAGQDLSATGRAVTNGADKVKNGL
jgi:predicted small secreted protein